MSLPVCNDPDAATVEFLESIHISDQSSSEDDFGSVPPSPEIGMAREGGGDISDADLSLEEEEDDVDPSPPGTLSKSIGAPNDSATSTPRTAGQSIEQPQMRQNQHSPPKGVRNTGSDSEVAHLTTPISECPPTRRSARAKGTLIYDQKYHPMDDFIRPSQAAKRRSLHGEVVELFGCSGTSTDPSGSEVGSMVGDEDSGDEDSQPPTRGRKRKRSRSQTPEPTRRSSRRRAKPKVSYNMKIHPQDSDLARVYACDGSKSSPSPNKRERSSAEGHSRQIEPVEECGEACHDLPTDPLRDDTASTLSSKLSSHFSIAVDPPQTLNRKLCAAYLNLRPDVAYLTASQNAWPEIKGLPFSIFTERMEDQLHAEAEAASPFHYNDDDKENDVTNPELTPVPNPLDGISIIPASHYRQRLGPHALPRHGAMVSNAFYAHPRFEASPYGLGWSDGAHDLNNGDTHDCPADEYMRILASSEHLPRSSLQIEDSLGAGGTAMSSSPARNVETLELLR